MRATIWDFDGIRMGHSISSFTTQTSFSGSNTNDIVRLHFGLKGDYKFYYKQLDKTFDLVGSHHNIMYSNGFDIEVHNKTLKIETFGIQFPTHLFLSFVQQGSDNLKRFAEDIVNGNNRMMSEQWGAIDSSIQQAIQQIIHCSYCGDLKKVFLLSKCIELLVLSSDAYDLAAARKETFIKTKSDKEKLIAARDIINERVKCPPNLSEVARSIGMNEYKLKRGFKETFNTTVFGYLTGQRLQLANLYLRNTAKTAAEISEELGYATPQHFNNAFKKTFGVTPSALRAQ